MTPLIRKSPNRRPIRALATRFSVVRKGKSEEHVDIKGIDRYGGDMQRKPKVEKKAANKTKLGVKTVKVSRMTKKELSLVTGGCRVQRCAGEI
jgi:hypothetical protein